MISKFHINEIAEHYFMCRTNVYRRMKILGLKGAFFTAEEAHRIGSMDGKLDVGYMYRKDDYIPSKLNFYKTTAFDKLSKHTNNN